MGKNQTYPWLGRGLALAIKLIIALDFADKNAALALMEQLDPATCAVKIGSEMFTLFGSDFVRSVVAKGFKVFLDLKFHDIPHTVASASTASADLGVWMLNVHASGGLAMMQAARKALDSYGVNRPLLIAVTVLTSMDGCELPTIGIVRPVQEHVAELARLAQQAELDGVVCSALEASLIKIVCGHKFLTVTPGIRLAHEPQDDQTRIMTPVQALKAGSDYLVIGRPITRAAQPAEVLRDLLLTLTE